MKNLYFALTLLTLLCSLLSAEWTDPLNETRAQRDARMEWWRDARFGMFIHWGVYSVPAGTYKGEEIRGGGEWILRQAEIPIAEYKNYASQFNPVNYDPDAWVRLAKRAGMKYIVITSKHHDGFALYDSAVTGWDVVDATPYGEDLLKPLEKACIRHGIKLGFYYSQAQDWVHPGGAKARLSEWEGWDDAHKGDFDRYLHQIAYPQVKEILNDYELDILWWDTPVWMNKQRADLLRRLIKIRPGLITNNRLGGGYEGDFSTPEQRVPATGLDYDWETCMTMNTTWGYKSYDDDWKSSEMLIRKLIDIASKGGNFLLNVGPNARGEIPDESIERLHEIGRWMDKNGDSIYGTTASPFRKLPWGRCTQKDGILYLHILEWPNDGYIRVPGLNNDVKRAYVLADNSKIKANHNGREWYLRVNKVKPDPVATVIVLEIDGKPDVDPLYPSNRWDGAIELNPDMSDIEQSGHNDRIEIVKGREAEYIDNWNSSRSYLAWDFMNNSSRLYQVIAKVRSSDPAATRILMQVQLGDQQERPVGMETLQLGRWSYVNLGTIQIPTGLNTLQLHRRPMGDSFPKLQLENVMLVPVQ